MKKWLIYVLGVISGIVITFVFAYFINRSNNSGIIGLQLFEEPGEYMDYSQFDVLQVIDSGCALAHPDGELSTIVLIIPNDGQQFYDNQEIILNNDECAQRVGTYRYETRIGIEKTVPVIEIIKDVELSESNSYMPAKNNSGKTLFDKPGECVSRKNFEVQEVLESGDAIALEIRDNSLGYIFTSDLEVLLLAQDGSNFYNKQIVKAPKGKLARQVGNYKYQKYGKSKVIPIVAFK